MKIDLITVLTGGSVNIKLIDGRTLVPKIASGDFVKPGEVSFIFGETDALGWCWSI